MNESFEYYSIRAKKARLGKILKAEFFRPLSLVISLTLLVSGLSFILFMNNSAGWLCLGFIPPIFMVNFWNKYHIQILPIGKNETITDLLSNDCLSFLPKDPTPVDIVEAAFKTRSGVFVSNRFLLGKKTVESIAKNITSGASAIFDSAIKIRNETNSAQVTGAILIIAVVEAHPESEAILRELKLSIDDLRQGTIWFNYLSGMVKDAAKTRHTGGIGRDLAFGYTPLLSHFAVNVSAQREAASRTQIHQGDRKDILEKMVALLSKNGLRNVALVGPYGSGRTTIVEAFAETLLDANSKIPSNLKFSQIFVVDASALIAASDKAGSLEQLVPRIIGEAYRAKNAILCFDNAHLFFENGNGSVDISNIILPYITGGATRMIFEMDEQKFLEIATKNAPLANALNKVIVTGTNKEETMKILQDLTPSMEYNYGVIFTYYSLVEAYRLSERYIKDVEMPGKAKLLLQSAANFAEGKLVTAKSVQEAIEKTQGIKIQTEKTEEEKKKLLNLEDEIHKRMIDQVPAVRAVSDALRRSAAGVRNENRPIGTFLFIGPTGVGKTELAKAISEVYFNGENQIVRIDLNEYVGEYDVQRLIADAADNSESLTAQVSKHPFSVVLLDEIEKAHPKVLTTLLQVLDEGILRDVKNREISFRDTIIIATSNAGADKIRESIDAGMDIATLKEEITNNLVETGEFRPEFLNRFDEICLFKPLSKEDLRQILELIVGSVNKTLDNQKIQVSLDDEAAAFLIDRGYDPKMGARPMRRIVQKTIENIVAKAVLNSDISAGANLVITSDMINGELD